MVPTVHTNWHIRNVHGLKMVLVNSGFGGGQDLTPYYLFKKKMQFTFIKRAKLLVTNTISEFLSKSSKTM
jgi:coproporphyrinogen III oxidase